MLSFIFFANDAKEIVCAHEYSGASDVACEVAKLATHLGFLVTVADYDPAFLNEERFPGVQRILFEGGNFDDLQKYAADSADYVCVLTRGHMYDPQSCAWGVACNAHYVGMMGCKGKNETVHDLVIGLGATEEGWARTKRPIGLKFGAKTPAELAVSIAAELIDVRYKENYSDAARVARKPFGLSVLSKAKKTTTPRTCEYAGRFLCGDKVAFARTSIRKRTATGRFCGSRCGTRCLVARLPSASAPDAGPTAAALPPKDQCGSAVRSTQAPSAFPGTRGSRRCKSGTCRWRLRRIGHTRKLRGSGIQ